MCAAVERQIFLALPLGGGILFTITIINIV
jgi:hypothetical protein